MAFYNVSNVYCGFCGVILQRPGMSAVQLSRPQRPWCCDIRAVYVDTQSPATPTPSLSSPGYLTAPSFLAANLDSKLPFSPIPPPTRICLFQRVGRYWGYGFHDDCWMLLLAKLSHSGIVDEYTILTSIFQLFYMTECPDFSAFSFGHDYGGVAKDQHPFWGWDSISSDLPQNTTVLLPPMKELDYNAYLTLTAKTLSNFAMSNARVALAKDSSSILKLPLEIFHLIIQNLSLADMANVRVACQEFALKTDPQTLPSSFWKSRFLPGFELDYVLPGANANFENWLRLFCGIMTHIKSGSKVMVNKKRIWNVLEHIVRVVEFSASESIEFHGKSVFLEENPDRERDRIYRLEDNDMGDHPFYLTSELSFSGLVVREDDQNQLTKGCRLLHYKSACFKSLLGDGQAIEVSTVQLGGRLYVSGFGISGSQDSGRIGSAIGLFLPGKKELIQIPNNLQIEFIEVAFRPSGLAGIRFLCTENHKSLWVGDNKGPGIVYGVLQLSQGCENYNLVVGIDAFKIVSLSSVKTHDTILNAKKHCQEKENEELNIRSHLWKPGPPDYQEITLTPRVPLIPSGPFDPLISIDFGGLDVGLGFIYGDGTLVFGLQSSVGISLMIDGPGGERIASIGVVTDDAETTILGLQVTTNRGRSMDFSPLRQDTHGRRKVISLQSERGNLITGFVAIQSQSRVPYVLRIGLQCRSGQLSNQLVDPQSIWEQDLDYYLSDIESKRVKASAMSITSRGFGEFSTYASMIGVRKIQSFIGCQGTTRESHHLSGLRFDYHNPSHSPAVVGQRLTPRDTWEISTGESIVKLTVYYFREERCQNVHGSWIGKMAAARFDTSHGRSMTFTGNRVNMTLDGSLVTHEFEPNCSENLSGISWVLNQTFDVARAVMKPGPSPFPDILVPGVSPPRDQIHKIYFNLNNLGQQDRLARIAAHRIPGHDSIMGLSFIYDSKAERSIGYTSDRQAQTIEMAPEGQIIRFIVEMVSHKLTRLEFQFKINPPDRPEGNYTSALEGRNTTSLSGYSIVHSQATWYISSAPPPWMTSQPHHDVHCAPEGAELVGIYISCQDLHQIGAIFRVDGLEELN